MRKEIENIIKTVDYWWDRKRCVMFNDTLSISYRLPIGPEVSQYHQIDLWIYENGFQFDTSQYNEQVLIGNTHYRLLNGEQDELIKTFHRKIEETIINHPDKISDIKLPIPEKLIKKYPEIFTAKNLGLL